MEIRTVGEVMEDRDESKGSSAEQTTSDSCDACPLGEAVARRAFLRDAAIAAAAIFTTLGVAAAEAHAMPVRLASALSAHEDERTYPIPSADGATIDKEESVIVVRWEGSVYVFSLACPHQNTALKWEAQESRFQCPKHHSKYRPDGSFIEGRATRGMDRFAIRRDNDKVVVDLDKLYQQDSDLAAWKAAVIQV